MKKKNKLTVIETNMGLFDFDVGTIYGDFNEAKKIIDKHFEEGEVTVWDNEDWKNPQGRCFSKRGYAPIIWLPRKPVTMYEHSALAHEALHAVCKMFEWAGIPWCRETEEVATHALQRIVHNSLK